MILQKFSHLYQQVKHSDQKLFTALDTISLNFDALSKSVNALSIVSTGSIVIYGPVTLTSNITVNSTSIPVSGASVLIIIFRQDGTGGRTITWNTGFAYTQNVTLAGDLLANTQCVFIFVKDPISGLYNLACQPIIGESK